MGRVASWTSGKEIKLQAREWSSTLEARYHAYRYWAGNDTGTTLAMPLIGITAIG